MIVIIPTLVTIIIIKSTWPIIQIGYLFKPDTFYTWIHFNSEQQQFNTLRNEKMTKIKINLEISFLKLLNNNKRVVKFSTLDINFFFFFFSIFE